MKIILIKLGSIQEYIIESRKLLDLQNSSSFLSEIMSYIVKKLKVEYDGEILLPKIINESNSIPNYILAIYRSSKNFGENINGYISEYLHGKLSVFNTLDKVKLINHINSIIDIYWLEREVNDDFLNDDKVYSSIYDEINQMMDSLKYTKKFTWTPSTGDRCSLCGKREGIVNIDNKPEDIILKDKECLCGACFIKRLNNKYHSKSLAKICLTNWTNKYKDKCKENEKFNELEKCIENNIEKGKYDKYEILYEDTLINKLIEKEKSYDYIEHIKELYEKIDKQDKYYCVYRFDIDYLGEWMAGNKGEYSNLKVFQEELSGNISTFFESISKYFAVKENDNNILIYAGGDDLLAVLPTKDIFGLMKEVKKEFDRYVKINEYDDITYSQGVFIAHYKDPFNDSIRLSKERIEILKEKLDKLYSSKDGLVISVLTEGFYFKEFYIKNHIDREDTSDILIKLINYFKNYSSYFHYDLIEEFSSMIKTKNKRDYIISEIKEMIEIEQTRIMKRKMIKEDNEKFSEINKIVRDLLYEDTSKDIQNYFDMFDIIKKLISVGGGQGYETNDNKTEG